MSFGKKWRFFIVTTKIQISTLKVHRSSVLGPCSATPHTPHIVFLWLRLGQVYLTDFLPTLMLKEERSLGMDTSLGPLGGITSIFPIAPRCARGWRKLQVVHNGGLETLHNPTRLRFTMCAGQICKVRDSLQGIERVKSLLRGQTLHKMNLYNGIA